MLAIVLVLFGGKRLRSLGGDLGGAIKGFRSAMKEGEKDEATREAERLADSRSEPARPADSAAQARASRRLSPRVFDIGFGELLLVGVIALLVLGPERLPQGSPHGRAVDGAFACHGAALYRRYRS